MKIIKAMDVYGDEIYVNIKYILYIEKSEYDEGYTKIQLTSASTHVKGTPEQIVAMIHEAEGK